MAARGRGRAGGDQRDPDHPQCAGGERRQLHRGGDESARQRDLGRRHPDRDRSRPSSPPLRQSQSPTAGANVALGVTASGATGYQWQLNGTAIAGATSSTLALGNIGTYQSGSYAVAVSNASGSVTSSAAVVNVSYNARLTNLSARANVGTGGNVLLAGFSLKGGSTKELLLRGIGPALVNYNVSGFLDSIRS